MAQNLVCIIIIITYQVYCRYLPHAITYLKSGGWTGAIECTSKFTKSINFFC